MHIILKRPDQNDVIPTQTFKYTQLIEERKKKTIYQNLLNMRKPTIVIMLCNDIGLYFRKTKRYRRKKLLPERC